MANVTRSGFWLTLAMFRVSDVRDVVNRIFKANPLGDFTDKELDDIHVRLSVIICRAIRSNAPIANNKPSSQRDVETLSPENLWSEAFHAQGPINTKELRSEMQKASKACDFLLDLINVKEGLQLLPPVIAETRNRVLDWLRLNPEVSQGAEFFNQVEAIMQGVSQLKHACEMAEFDLSITKFPSGPQKNTWYNDFTELLITICCSRNVKPTLSRNSQTEEPSGKLFALAKAMEELLPKELRSPTDKARFQRLKTARKAVAKRG